MYSSLRTIYFYGSIRTPQQTPFRGGQFVTLKHVEVLRERGFRAHIVTSDSRFRRLLRGHIRVPPPFVHYTRFVQVLDQERDIVVVPGRHITSMSDVPGKNKVLFSQGAYITFRSMGVELLHPAPWQAPELRAILCVSESNAELFRRLEPSCPVFTIPIAVSSSISIGKELPLREQLVLTPSLSQCEKNPFDTTVLIQLLRRRMFVESAKQFRCVPLEERSYAEVIDLLQRARLLVFLGLHEGFGRLPLEAMRAGAIVLAWDRRPLSDILPSACLAECGDFSTLLDKAVSVMLDHTGRWKRVVEASYERAKEFSEERLARNVVDVWRAIFARLEGI